MQRIKNSVHDFIIWAFTLSMKLSLKHIKVYLYAYQKYIDRLKSNDTDKITITFLYIAFSSKVKYEIQ